jgi:hypothetical protein
MQYLLFSDPLLNYSLRVAHGAVNASWRSLEQRPKKDLSRLIGGFLLFLIGLSRDSIRETC